MKKFIGLLMVICSFQAWAEQCPDRGPNVILFTWDGVRSHEFFQGTGFFHRGQLEPKERGQIFSTFWREHADGGVVLGKRGSYRIGSKVAVSLPSYQALALGRTTDCKKNDCQSVQTETVFEAVKRELGLDKKDVAVFASWNRIKAAVAAQPESITQSIYPDLLPADLADENMRSLELKAQEDLPGWSGSRKDTYTFELGLSYLKKHCPRLLYISLVDSDEFAHEGDYPGYVRSMRTYDDYLDRLLTLLREQGSYGENTTVLVTTDHSRGAGPFWRGHAVTSHSEKEVFLFATGRGVRPQGHLRAHSGHLAIRPTIEYLFGLKPSDSTLPGIQLQE